MIELYLRDRNQKLVAAWRQQFAGVRGVNISRGDIFALPDRVDAIVSPANSYGMMDGGIDRVYCEHFGWRLQEHLQDALALRPGRMLPVGEALLIPTGDDAIPWMVSAPTMRQPGDVSNTENAYLAFRALLRVVHGPRRKPPIERVLCPGMCTAAGRMPPERAASQMRRALDDWRS